MVGRAAGDGARVGRIRCLYDVPDFSERLLSFWPWDGHPAGAFVRALADVLAADRAAEVGAGVDFAGDVHSVDAGRLSTDLLLLSQGVLSGVLFGSAGLLRGRAAG